MWTREQIKTRAKEVLKTSYWKAFVVSLVIVFVGGSGGGGSFNYNFNSNSGGNSIPFNNFSPSMGDMLPFIFAIVGIAIVAILLGLAFRVLLGYPLEVGGRRFFVRSAQGDTDMSYLGYAFKKGYYLDIIKTMFLKGIYNFLWFLLLIIPGIVKSYAYSMVPYILADNPNIGPQRAIELSNEMTDGQKFNMWVLDLSFIGWYLLGTLALLIGVFFVNPYNFATKAELYLVLREDALARGLCSHGELGLIPPEATEI